MGVFENPRFLRKFRKKTFYFEKSKKILKKKIRRGINSSSAKFQSFINLMSITYSYNISLVFKISSIDQRVPPLVTFHFRRFYHFSIFILILSIFQIEKLFLPSFTQTFTINFSIRHSMTN